MYLQVALNFAPTDEQALEAAHYEWRQVALSTDDLGNLDSPVAFDRATTAVTRSDVGKKMRVSASVEQHIAWLSRDIELGFERVFLHNVHRDQERFISIFSEKVLPTLAG